MIFLGPSIAFAEERSQGTDEVVTLATDDPTRPASPELLAEAFSIAVTSAPESLADAPSAVAESSSESWTAAPSVDKLVSPEQPIDEPSTDLQISELPATDRASADQHKSGEQPSDQQDTDESPIADTAYPQDNKDNRSIVEPPHIAEAPVANRTRLRRAADEVHPDFNAKTELESKVANSTFQANDVVATLAPEKKQILNDLLINGFNT